MSAPSDMTADVLVARTAPANLSTPRVLARAQIGVKGIETKHVASTCAFYLIRLWHSCLNQPAEFRRRAHEWHEAQNHLDSSSISLSNREPRDVTDM